MAGLMLVLVLIFYDDSGVWGGFRVWAVDEVNEVDEEVDSR